MSIKFKSVQRVNPQDVTAPKKFYAKALQVSITELDELAELVASQCTMSKADCYGVLIALETNIIRELKSGRNIRLGILGTYRVSVSAEGQTTEEEVISSTIKKSRINFTPGTGLKEMLGNLKYEKAQN